MAFSMRQKPHRAALARANYSLRKVFVRLRDQRTRPTFRARTRWTHLCFLVEHVVNVPAPLVVDAENRPDGFALALSLVALRLRVPHFSLKIVECSFDEVPSVGGWRAPSSFYFRHVCARMCRSYWSHMEQRCRLEGVCNRRASKTIQKRNLDEYRNCR